MKAILILCLLVTLNCDIISTAFCLIENEKIRSFAKEAISKIKNKKYADLPTLVISNFSSLKDAVISCIGQKEEEDEVVLKDFFTRYRLCLQKCSNNGKLDQHSRDVLQCTDFCLFKGRINNS